MKIKRIVPVAALFLSAVLLFAAELKQPAIEAFAKYVQTAEQRMQQQTAEGKFFYADTLPQQEKDAVYAAARAGDPKMIKIDTPDAPDAMIHDWVGLVFIPGATFEEVKQFMQDYNVHARYYGPDMTQSKLLSQNGNDYKIFFRLYKSKLGVTANINVNMDVKYSYPDGEHLIDVGHGTRVAEVENAGKTNEKELPVGNDRGLLWRLNSYWRAEQRDGGVYVESEAITLTKSPMWPISSFIKGAAKDSVENMLVNIRKAVPQHARLAAKS